MPTTAACERREAARANQFTRVENSESLVPGCVLIADSCPDTIETTKQLLRLWGHDVKSVRTGPEVLEAVRIYRPTVVLMEIWLPKLNGWQVARRLRQQLGGSTPLLIAVSGCGTEIDQAHSREAGFDYHLVKPVYPDVLQSRLRLGRQKTTGASEMNHEAWHEYTDEVDMTSDASFPASDPPSWTPIIGIGQLSTPYVTYQGHESVRRNYLTNGQPVPAKTAMHVIGRAIPSR